MLGLVFVSGKLDHGLERSKPVSVFQLAIPYCRHHCGFQSTSPLGWILSSSHYLACPSVTRLFKLHQGQRWSPLETWQLRSSHRLDKVSSWKACELWTRALHSSLSPDTLPCSPVRHFQSSPWSSNWHVILRDAHGLDVSLTWGFIDGVWILKVEASNSLTTWVLSPTYTLSEDLSPSHVRAQLSPMNPKNQSLNTEEGWWGILPARSIPPEGLEHRPSFPPGSFLHMSQLWGLR